MFGWLAACTAPLDPSGPVPLDDRGSDGFFDAPWPSDTRRDEDGTLSLAGFPNPFGVPLVNAYLDRGEQLAGFGTSSPVYVRFDGRLDPRSMPTPEESVGPESPLVLVDVDLRSPFRGERIPVAWQQFGPEDTDYVPSHLLAVAPVAGFPMRPATTYALLVRTTIASPSPGFRSREPSALLSLALDDLGLDPEDVAIATVFTTQDPIGELADLAWFVRNQIGGPSFDAPMEHLRDFSHHSAYRTHYASPVFTAGVAPYLQEGGQFTYDGDGRPIVTRFDDLRLAVCVPVGAPVPEEGWPVVIFQHGTGGDYRGFCDDDDLLEVARRFGEQGVIGLGIDQPLHGNRPGSDVANDLAHFNIVNPDSGVTNFRQGALDAIYLARALASRPWTFNATGVAFETDPDRVLFMGHSQGGLTGALAAPFFAGDVDATMLSGAGGVLAITVIERKDPLDFLALVRGLLQVDETEELTPLHPALGLVQTLVEVTDPVNYAPYWFSEQGWWADHAPSAVLLTNGTADAATPYQTAIALAAAGRLPLVGEPATRSDAVRMRAGPPQPLPVDANAPAFDGTLTTSGFAQYADGSHFVIFEEEEAADLTYGWLRSMADGSGLFSAP